MKINDDKPFKALRPKKYNNTKNSSCAYFIQLNTENNINGIKPYLQNHYKHLDYILHYKGHFVLLQPKNIKQAFEGSKTAWMTQTDTLASYNNGPWKHSTRSPETHQKHSWVMTSTARQIKSI